MATPSKYAAVAKEKAEKNEKAVMEAQLQLDVQVLISKVLGTLMNIQVFIATLMYWVLC